MGGGSDGFNNFKDEEVAAIAKRLCQPISLAKTQGLDYRHFLIAQKNFMSRMGLPAWKSVQSSPSL